VEVVQMWNKRATGIAATAALIAVLSAIGSAAAFLVSTDAKVNSFAVGEVEISVIEPAWEEGTASTALEPGQQVEKDPVIKNTGVNDAFVFMVLDLPKAMGLMLFDENGSLQRTPPDKGTLLFEPQLAVGYDRHWKIISETDIDDPDREYLRQVWAYAVPQGEAFGMKPLAPGDSTLPLFEAVRYTWAVEGQGLTEKRFNLPVCGYAIQAESLGTDEPAKVWNILYSQTGQTGH
jgi:hypothetical protein